MDCFDYEWRRHIVKSIAQNGWNARHVSRLERGPDEVLRKQLILNRNALRTVTNLITGHCSLNRQYQLWINDPSFERCEESYKLTTDDVFSYEQIQRAILEVVKLTANDLQRLDFPDLMKLKRRYLLFRNVPWWRFTYHKVNNNLHF